MILDAQNIYSNAQLITATAASANQVDFGPISHANNSNGALHTEVLIHVNTTFTAAGAGTLQIQMRSSANANMSSPVVHDVSDVLALADLVAGTKIRFMPRVPLDVRRYTDLNYIVTTGPMTAGALTAVVVAERQTNQ